ncbi:class I SAM-dependent methyltransferase [Rhodopila sp.]|uniref:class I SAM-dependent methyltransferase n=1 Tax=Rhodopila sp. TaxID=2480087 RepID=UPI003D106B4E
MHTLEPKAQEAFDLVRAHRRPQLESFLAATPGQWWFHAIEAGERYDELVKKAQPFKLYYDHVCAAKSFSHDWFSDKIWSWHEVLAPFRDRSVNWLELGAFEGRSIVFAAEYLPRSRLVALDHFELKKGWTSTQDNTLSEDSETSFDHNVSSYGDRVRKIAMKSWQGLTLLVEEKAKFDIIYLDASHCAPDVLADATIAWRLLEVGGLFIFDDFLLDLWDWDKGPVGPGVLQFLKTIPDAYEWVHAGWQVVVRKTAEQHLW